LRIGIFPKEARILSQNLQYLSCKVRKYRNQIDHGWMEDFLAVEEPLEIRLEYGPAESRQGMSVAITMRTPGHDVDLALGFLLTEGVIDRFEQVEDAGPCGPHHPENLAQNIVKVCLRPGVAVDPKFLTRHVFTTSSCGICGKASLNAVRSVSRFKLDPTESWLDRNLLEELPNRLAEQQKAFQQTGGLHAAALFDKHGLLVAIFEDVGRHNALDKLIGSMLQQNQCPPRQHVLLVSGRASFELVQKAAMAGIPFLAAIGAPSSLAVSLAEEFGMGLAGFLKSGRINLYAGAQHVID
jgi:FdhD protein